MAQTSLTSDKLYRTSQLSKLDVSSPNILTHWKKSLVRTGHVKPSNLPCLLKKRLQHLCLGSEWPWQAHHGHALSQPPLAI